MRIYNTSGQVIYSDTRSTMKSTLEHAVSLGVDLKGADLSGADLHGANLCEAELREANLAKAYIRGTYLNGANLSEADLSGANLNGANLSEADLSGASLYEAYLYWVNLREANLREADLRMAILAEADLFGTDLSHSDLTKANFRSANLYGADLSHSDLTNTNFRCANLYGADFNGAVIKDAIYDGADTKAAKNLSLPLACPEKGSFIGWKKISKTKENIPYELLVKLEIPADAKRSSATTNKCRCSKAKVLEIKNILTLDCVDAVTNINETSCVYKVGEMVYPDSFDDNRWNECSHGIHFFMDKQDAIDY